MNKQVIDWIKKELKPQICNSVEFMYEEMDSQSGKCLPLIYTPFDANNRLHWCDRGYIFDYLFSTEGEGKTFLVLTWSMLMNILKKLKKQNG